MFMLMLMRLCASENSIRQISGFVFLFMLMLMLMSRVFTCLCLYGYAYACAYALVRTGPLRFHCSNPIGAFYENTGII